MKSWCQKNTPEGGLFHIAIENHRKVFCIFFIPSPKHNQKKRLGVLLSKTVLDQESGCWVNGSVRVSYAKWVGWKWGPATTIRTTDTRQGFSEVIIFHRCELWTWSYLTIFAHHIFTSRYILTIDSTILPCTICPPSIVTPNLNICKLPKFGRVINWIAASYGSWGGSSVKKTAHFHPFPMWKSWSIWIMGFSCPQVKKETQIHSKIKWCNQTCDWLEKRKRFFYEKKHLFLQLLCLQVKKINNFSSPCFQKRFFSGPYKHPRP